MPDGSCSAIRRRGPTNQVHLNLAPIIEAAPEGAKGISYLLMIDGPGHEVYGWQPVPRWRFRAEARGPCRRSAQMVDGQRA
jgi:hypothetical protein